jgi:hypothetical protein
MIFLPNLSLLLICRHLIPCYVTSGISKAPLNKLIVGLCLKDNPKSVSFVCAVRVDALSYVGFFFSVDGLKIVEGRLRFKCRTKE